MCVFIHAISASSDLLGARPYFQGQGYNSEQCRKEVFFVEFIEYK